MRGQHHVRQPDQTRVHLRLLLEDVEAGARDPSLPEGLDQGRLVHHRAPGRVDQVRGLLHGAE